MVKNWLSGLQFLYRGIIAFYRHKELYKYTLVPGIILALCYLLAGWLVWELGLAVHGWLPEPDEWYAGLRWLAVILYWLLFAVLALTMLLLMGVISNTLFEAFGALVFDTMVSRFMLAEYGVKSRKVTWRENFTCLCRSAWFAIVTLGWSVVWSLAGLWIPGVGFLLTPLLTGRRVAAAYLWAPLLLSGKLDEFKQSYREQSGVLAGFGFGCSFILAVPIIGLFGVPGMVLGGAMIYNERIKGCKNEQESGSGGVVCL